MNKVEFDRDSGQGLSIASVLHRFLVDEALPGSGVDEPQFWRGLSSLIHSETRRNQALLERRQELQSEIDRWCRDHRGEVFAVEQYRRFLEEIGYLQAPGPDFVIDPQNLDPEIAEIAGPQLVVPVTNARYALNAANARWGSLYDAVYGTDVLGDRPNPGPYDPARGARVIQWGRRYLDEILPLERASHGDAVAYRITAGKLEVETADGQHVGLCDPGSYAGYMGSVSSPSSLLLRCHGLHIELVIDRRSPVGSTDPAGLSDIMIESAITAIVDFEDSIAAVDASDKVAAYRNWLGLMKGDLSAEFTKNAQTVRRDLVPDRLFRAPDGSPLHLPGRALLLVRNVGHFTMTDAVLDRDSNPVPEGLIDAMVTVLCAMHDLRRTAGEKNSRQGSIYVVKPKMQGPEEVAFADDVFAQVEESLGLPHGTVKIGLMDEERRTSLNLKECIRAARSRIAFINTGFLDRTGDEIHTSMYAGAMVRKAEMRVQPWLGTYEDNNVDVGLSCGLLGRAQIGKGMWAAPDLMAKMLEEKIAHPRSGASTAWVPSPTAATLHATHYHRVDVAAVQRSLANRSPAVREEMLRIPVDSDRRWTALEVSEELDNNAQGILGYAVRWIDQGIGCSKVLDINDVALMEDRATCRISSQHVANWLYHGVVDREQVVSSLKRMAAVVDRQNLGDPAYRPMSPDFDGPAFKAAHDLILSGLGQPSGYTEPVLYAYRRQVKDQTDALSYVMIDDAHLAPSDNQAPS